MEALCCQVCGERRLHHEHRIAENGVLSSEVFALDLNKSADGSFSTKATLITSLADTENENANEKSAARCVPAR